MKQIYKNIVRTALGIVALGLSFSSYGQFTENFDAGTSIPTGWSVINNGDPNGWEFGPPQSADSPHSPPNVARIDYSYSGAHDDYLITPQISVIAGTSDQLRFYGMNYSSTLTEEFYVLVSTSGATETDFTDTLAGPLGPPKEWTEYVYDLSAYATQDIYIAFQAISSNEYYLYLDDITIEKIPTCPRPTDLAAAGISDQIGNVTWTAGGSESEWNVSWGIPGYTPGDGDEIGTDNGVTTNSTQATGLSPNTEYDVYVQAHCGPGDESIWEGPVTFKTTCVAVIAPWTYDVETATETTSSEIEDCWSSDPGFTSSKFRWDVEGSGGDTPSSSTGPDTPYSGDSYFYTEATSGSENDSTYLTSPQIDISGLTNPALSFYYHMYGQTMGSLHVQVSEDGGGTWTTEASISGEQQTDGGDPWKKRFIVLSSYSGTITVRFIGVRGSDFYGDMAIDDIAVDEAPSCLEPTDIAATATTDQTADITWIIGDSETDWNISWGSPGYTPGDANEIGTDVSSTTSYQITGLSPNTSYDVYVQADCGGDLSGWTGPFTFTTTCATYMAPWTYDVETATATTSSEIEDCWSSVPGFTSSAFRWDVVGDGGGTPSSSTGPDASYNGNYYFYTEASSGSTGDSAFLTSPPVDVSALTVPAVKFYYHMYGQEIDNLSLQVTNDGGATWTTENTISGEQQGSGSDPWEKELVDLTGYSGTISIRFVAVRGSGYYGDIAIDQISVVELPTCFEPIDMFIGQANDTSATVVWTPGDPMSNTNTWNIVWGPPGFTPGDANQIGSATSMDDYYTITGLTPNSEYDVYVQEDCGGGDASTWSGPLNFSNAYCIPTGGTTTYFLDDVTTIGALTNLNNVGSGTSPDGYGDFTATDTLVVYPGQIIDFTFSAGNSYTMHYFAWIDWLQNANFDDINPMEQILATSTYEASHTFTYTIPNLSPSSLPMTTRLRVRGAYTGSNLGPCETASNTETEDYIIKVVNPPSCLPPINLSLVSETTTEIEIGWDEQNTATEWNIEYGPTGFTPGTGTIISGVGTNPYTVTGLNPSTAYDFYVQSDCGSGDESFWSGVLTANTDCGIVMAPFYEGFNSGEQPDCWGNLSSNSSSSAANFWKFDGNVESGAQYNGKPSGTFAFSDGDTPKPDSMILMTPKIDLSALTNPALSFEWFSNNTSNPGDNTPLIILVSKDSVNWTTLDTLKGDNPNWQFVSYGLDAFANETIRVAFMTNQTIMTTSAYLNDILLDEVKIDDCNGGQPGSKDICRLDGMINLNDNIIVPPNGGGKWYGGVELSGLITNDSILNVSSLPAGSYEVYYSERTVCFDTTIATINIYSPSSAGDGNTIHSCKNAPLNIFSSLSGNVDMGGEWYDYDGNLLPNSQPTAPTIEASYNYLYVVSNGVCPADTSIVEVIVDNCWWVGLEEEAFTDISVYPNPASNQINIVNPSNASDLRIEVLDMNGRVVLIDNSALKHTSKATIAIDQLSKGVYTLRVYNDEGQKIFKVVKQ